MTIDYVDLIISVLKEKPCTTNDLMECTRLQRKSLLEIMRSDTIAGLVQITKKPGKRMVYTLADSKRTPHTVNKKWMDTLINFYKNTEVRAV